MNIGLVGLGSMGLNLAKISYPKNINFMHMKKMKKKFII